MFFVKLVMRLIRFVESTGSLTYQIITSPLLIKGCAHSALRSLQSMSCAYTGLLTAVSQAILDLPLPGSPCRHVVLLGTLHLTIPFMVDVYQFLNQVFQICLFPN